MVYSYKRKTTQGSWSEECLHKAMTSVKSGMPLREATRQYNVPRTTLQRHIRANKVEKRLGRFRSVFTASQEKQLLNCISRTCQVFHGLTTDALRVLAYEFAKHNGIKHPFKHGRAGEGWSHNFLSRHSALKTDFTVTSFKSANANQEWLRRFFGSLRFLYTQHQFKPNRVYSCVHTSLLVSPVQPPHVLSADTQLNPVLVHHGEVVSGLYCCNAIGATIPPALVFHHRSIRTPCLLDGAPRGTLGMVSGSGLITTELFLSWLSFFVRQVRPVTNEPVLLVVDDFAPFRSLSVLSYAATHNVLIISAPSNKSLRPNPLSQPVETSLAMCLEGKAHGYHPELYDALGAVHILSNVFARLSCSRETLSGFVDCGIYPYDPNVFENNTRKTYTDKGRPKHGAVSVTHLGGADTLQKSQTITKPQPINELENSEGGNTNFLQSHRHTQTKLEKPEPHLSTLTTTTTSTQPPSPGEFDYFFYKTDPLFRNDHVNTYKPHSHSLKFKK